MRQCVALLRAAWYGDGGEKKAVDCAGLVRKAQKEANVLINTAGVGDGLSGTITNLTVADDAVFVDADETADILLVAEQNMLLPAEEDGFAQDMPDDAEVEDQVAEDDTVEHGAEGES